MANEDGSVWVTFNGEIYNHAELRKNLRLDERHTFRSRADTEVIVHLYEEQGLDMVRAIDGMFAIGLWDARKRQLILVRDRMGKKPIYYTLARGRLLFASEVKALLAHPDVPRRLDLTALNQYLTFSNVPRTVQQLCLTWGVNPVACLNMWAKWVGLICATAASVSRHIFCSRWAWI